MIHGGVLCQQKSGTASLVVSEKRDMKQQLIPEVGFKTQAIALGAISTQVSFNCVKLVLPQKCLEYKETTVSTMGNYF